MFQGRVQISSIQIDLMRLRRRQVTIESIVVLLTNYSVSGKRTECEFIDGEVEITNLDGGSSRK